VSIQRRPNGKWRARYRDLEGREHAKHFTYKAEAEEWLRREKSALVEGRWSSPSDRRMLFRDWAERWLAGYHARPSTVRVARTHLKVINKKFGSRPIGEIKASEIRAWSVEITKQYSAGYSRILRSRLFQVLEAAVQDGVIGRNPAKIRGGMRAERRRPRIVPQQVVWDLYDTVKPRWRVAVLLGAFAGLRVGEVCGLTWNDVDLVTGLLSPSQQWKGAPLKTRESYNPIPIPENLTQALRDQYYNYPSEWVISNQSGGPVSPRVFQYEIQRAKTELRIPDFRFHDLRHFYASALIKSGADVKLVQARVRHRSAVVTLDTYAHLWPDSDELTRRALDAMWKTR